MQENVWKGSASTHANLLRKVLSKVEKCSSVVQSRQQWFESGCGWCAWCGYGRCECMASSVNVDSGVCAIARPWPDAG